MDEDNTAEVDSSVENTPSEETEADIGSDDQPSKTSQEELYDLPDGRKVTAKVLQQEWKQNFMPDYTKKSTELKRIKEERESIKEEPKPVAKEPWEEPGWQPKTWQEVFEAGKRATLREVSPLLSEVEQGRQQRELTAQATKAAETEMASIKESDPRVNEEAVYQHANKFGFSNLTQAYNNMKAMKELEKITEAKVLKNLKARQGDNVGISVPGTETDNTPTYDSIHSFKSARSAAAAALRSIQGK